MCVSVEVRMLLPGASHFDRISVKWRDLKPLKVLNGTNDDRLKGTCGGSAHTGISYGSLIILR